MALGLRSRCSRQAFPGLRARFSNLGAVRLAACPGPHLVRKIGRCYATLRNKHGQLSDALGQQVALGLRSLCSRQTLLGLRVPSLLRSENDWSCYAQCCAPRCSRLAHCEFNISRNRVSAKSSIRQLERQHALETTQALGDTIAPVNRSRSSKLPDRNQQNDHKKTNFVCVADCRCVRVSA